MTSINAGGAFYRVQNSLNQNSEEVSKSMQRLASGRQNIAPGDRTASSSVAWGMKAEAASLKIGIQNGTEALQAVEMLNNDIQAMNDIVVRLEELYALSTNGFNTATDKAALEAEASTLLTEISRIATDAKWKGNTLANGTGKTVGFGRNGGDLDVEVAAFAIPDVTDPSLTRELQAFDIAGTAASGNDGATPPVNYTVLADRTDATSGNPTGVPTALASLKQNVDSMAVEAGAFTGGLPQRLPTTLSCLTNSSFSFSKYPRGSGGLVPQTVGLHEVQFDVSSPKHHLRNLLGNHDGRRIGVPTDNLGHHTCVHHA